MCFLPLYRSLLKRLHAAQNYPHHLQDIRFILSYPPLVSGALCTGAEGGGVGDCELRPLDNAQVVRSCAADLRRALLPPSFVSSPPPTVAERFIRMRELAWLRTRLEDISSEATRAIRREARMVESELGEGDFLDDDTFAENKMAAGTTEPCGGAGRDECAGGVASAGELGKRREMFVLRRVAPFPLAREYLSDFTMDPKAVATACASSERLVEFVQRHVPRCVECQNADLTLSVSVRLFDAAMIGRRVEQWEEECPFAQARRHFMLHFSLRPHDRRSRVDVVNSYFLRLDVASSELLEDVGYVHAAHVWQVAQTLGNEECGGALGDPDKSNNNNDNSNNNNAGNEGGEQDEVDAVDARSQFELSFLNPSDNPMVMKGQLYYTLRTDNDNTDASNLPIRVISFGHLLLFNGDV